MKKIINLIVLSVFFFTSCSEDVFKSLTNDEAPKQVSIVKTENGPGKSRIYFNLPDSESLLYIEGEFTDKGEKYLAKVSSYNNYIDLEGFSESKAYEVKLYSVSRGLNKSEPVVVTVNPELPPYLVTYNKMVADADFGGFNLNFENPSQASLAVFVEKFETSTNEWIALDAFYSQELNEVLTLRNLALTEQKYRFRIRDKFKNYSDYKESLITPWVESEMDYTKFAAYKLPNDPLLFEDPNPQPYNYLWNQLYVGTSTSSGGWVGTTNKVTSPENMITFDLGKTAKMTRFVIYQRGINDGTTLVYANANLKDFELYGSNDPNPNGSWDSWELVTSGSINIPAGTIADRLEIAKRGHEFAIAREIPAYRYLRLKQIRTFATAGNSRFFLAGIKLFENSNQ